MGSLSSEQVRDLVSTMGKELRALAVRLRPKALDDFGLEAALAAYAEEWSRQLGVPVDVHAATDDRRLPAAVESAVYRIVQEALTNVVKLASARHVSVVVESDEREVRLIVEDGGSRGRPWMLVAEVRGLPRTPPHLVRRTPPPPGAPACRCAAATPACPAARDRP